MAITEPTIFTATKSSGTARRFIISVTDGSSIFLFGNFEGTFPPAHVYHLVDVFNLTQSADFWENTWSRAIVRLTISNLPYKQSDNGLLRLSDEVGDIVGETARIYVTAEPNIELSNCLCIFDGITRSIDGYDEDKINITLEDNGYVVDTVLLTKQVKDID